MARRFTPPTRDQFARALDGFDFGWVVPPGWKQWAVDVETELDGAVVRVSTTIDKRGAQTARKSGENAIDLVLVDQMSGSFVLSRSGRVIAAKKVLRTGGPKKWGGRVRARVVSLRGRSSDAFRCESCGSFMVLRDGHVVCAECPAEVEQTCPDCGSSMLLRRNAKDGGMFWGCSSYPRCKKGVNWGQEPGPSPGLEDEDLRLGEARAVLDAARAEGEGKLTRVADRLGEVLDDDPEKGISLILGTATPAGKPTLEAIVQRRRDGAVPTRPQKPRRKKRKPADPVPDSPENPLAGLRLYSHAERPATAVEVAVPAEGAGCSPSSAFLHHEIKHETLNPIQTAVLPWVDRDVNLVVAAETSAGKTVAAEMMMADALERGGKAIFLSPLRAVSQEKHDDWRDPNHPWGVRPVSIATGDYTLTDARKKELRESDVIVLTSEMLDSKTRRMASENNVWLLRCLTLIVDEAHLLTMEGRGDALECGLMRFTRQNPHSRIVFLSATMPNVDELGRWLTRLNGKPTVVIESAWRPTKLTVHWPTYPARSGGGAYKDNEDSKRRAAVELVEDRYPSDKWIVFVHSKKAGYQLLKKLREDGEDVEFHNADLDRKRRLDLERRFRHGTLRVVIATSTLAYGINMPARRVLVLGIHRGIQEVDPIDVKQECGRAGRVGLDPEGDAYVLLPHEALRPNKTKGLRRRFSEVGRIESRINDLDVLAFHLTAEVAEGDVTSETEAVEWHARSLAAFQGHALVEEGQVVSAGNVLGRLARSGILKKNGFTYDATMLGRVSSWLYYSPFDVAGWCSNFRHLLETDRLRDDDCLAWALGCVRTGFESYLPKDHEHDMQQLEWRLRAKGIENRLPPTVLAFESLLTGTEYRGMVSQTRQIAYDSDRIIAAIELIDRHVIKGLGRPYCDLLAVRVRYGCTWDEAELCRMPGVGAKRAHELVKVGILSLRDALANKAEVVAVMGKRRAIPALRRAKELIS